MAILSTLTPIVFTTTEQQTVQGAVGSEDAQGMLSTITDEIAECIAKLNRLNSYLPAGANKTAIAAAATALA